MKNYLLFLGFILISSILYGQPDEAYINKLTGQLDQDWLGSVGNSISLQQFEWGVKEAPGFKKTSSFARKQALLTQPWNFFKIDTAGHISNGIKVRLPHSFEQKRNYKSGWYVIKYPIDKNVDKQYILRLDRVQMFSMVFVNGKRCRHHFGSFTPFDTDITDKIIPGENVLAIYVRDISATQDGNKLYNQIGPRGRMINGGITTVPVLEIRDKSHISDIFVKTSTRKGEMEIEYELAPEKVLSSNSKLSFELFRWPEGDKVDLEMPSISFDQYSKNNYSTKVKWQNPDLWSPDHPNLYVLRTIFQDGKYSDINETRFGFREFWIEGKSFFLNGVPIRLRGDGIYGIYGDGIAFHKAVLEKQKQLFGVNTCRMHHEIPNRDVIYAADEAGMLLDNQSAIWSSSAAEYRNGGEWFLRNTEIEFEEWVRRDRNSPSVIIWDAENEMLRVSFELHLPWVQQLPFYILRFDNTRPINHSGAGWFSPYQHLVWLHMQEHYSKIMSDWVSKGTNPLVMGEFWVGGRADFERLPNSPELTSPDQYILENAIVFSEKILEMRYVGVSGVMPFKLFSMFNADNLKEEQQKLKHALQAVTIFLWPRQKYVEAGNNLKREVVICNDGETEGNFEVSWRWGNLPVKSQTVFLRPSEQKKIAIDEKPLLNNNQLVAVLSGNNQIISTDTLLIRAINPPKNNSLKTLLVYNDPDLANLLALRGFKTKSDKSIPELKDDVLWIIPEHANNRELSLIKEKILAYLEKGGNILCLKQDQAPTWFPVNLPFWSAYQAGIHNYALMGWKGLNKDLFFANEVPIYAKSHPVFSGISDMPFHLWDKFDGRVSDHVFSRPSYLSKYEPGNWRPLSGGTRLEHVSLAEMFYGKGIFLACQLNVIENLENIQARNLFYNMINYLSGKPTVKNGNKLIVRGSLKPSDITQLTGVRTRSFEGASAKNHDLMIATDGADVSEIKKWASAGGKVLVLSGKLAQAFDGVKVNNEPITRVAKTADHPLLDGVCSVNFSKVNLPLANGFFRNIPAQAKDLLRGFTQSGGYGPVVISLSHAKGEILLSTIEIQNQADNLTRELLCLLLTNCGIPVPINDRQISEIAVKKTVPLTIDGSLKDWTEDMEDRLVTKFIHAQPVYLTSESILEGPPEFDLNLSAINYYLWNEQALYISGVVFSEERTWESGITWGSKKEYQMDIRLNSDVITIVYKNNEAKVWVNSKQGENIFIKTGQINSKDMTDASALQFNYIFKSGETKTVANLTGETLELMIPWNLLNFKPSEENIKALIMIKAKGSRLQVPLKANLQSKDNWLDMRIKNNNK